MKFVALAAALFALSGCIATEGVVVGVGVSDGPRHHHHHRGYGRPYYGPGYWAPPPPPYYGYPPRYRRW
ncbi:MAG: hypothetical protein JNK67_13280 [Alphaproteobacteria bacterium]|nr:hypothetical protein [Alphaproteobacteria bacterium]